VKLGGADWDKSILYCPDCAWNNIEIDSNDSRIAELESENKKLSNWILRSHFQATISEGKAAELLSIDRIELRQMMIDRYGEDWRYAADDDELAKRRMIAAGDLQETIDYLRECGFGVRPDGTTYELED
jgi:hypothetical protein